MKVCLECDLVISRGGLEVLVCAKCGNLIHSNCAYLSISKSYFETSKKANLVMFANNVGRVSDVR